MSKRKNTDNITIYMSKEEKNCIEMIFKHLSSKVGIFYLLKQLK